MTTEHILLLDCREDENKEIIQKALRKIKPLKRYENLEDDVPLEMIEKVINVITSKYCICIQWISHHKQPIIANDSSIWWSCSLKTDNDHKWLGSFYAATMYELLAKCAIKMYSCTVNNSIKKRDPIEEEERKQRLMQMEKEAKKGDE